jgi:hypothetical protein
MNKYMLMQMVKSLMGDIIPAASESVGWVSVALMRGQCKGKDPFIQTYIASMREAASKLNQFADEVEKL